MADEGCPSADGTTHVVAEHTTPGNSCSPKTKGYIMTDGVHDRVEVKNIFEPGHSKGGGMDGMWAAILPALAQNRGGSHYGDGFGFGGGGFGAGFVGGILGGLIFNRRGGFFGGEGGEGCGGGGRETRIEDTVFQTAVLSKLGTVEAAIPQAECHLQAAIAASTADITSQTLQQTIALERDLASLALGTQQAFANTKDAVQTGFALVGQAICGVNQNVSSQGCQTREAIQNDGDKTRALLVSRFQLEDATAIANLNAKVVELQSEGRRRADHDELRLQITNTNTAVAAQAQGQQQQQQQFLVQTVASILPALNALINESQIARATNSNLIVGSTGVLTGAQSANPTNVRA